MSLTPWNVHGFVFLCFAVVILLVLSGFALCIYPYSLGLFHWHWGDGMNISLPMMYSISQEICTRFCFAVLCCGYTLTDFPISIRLTSLALWQSNDCPSASKATLMSMDKHFMWIHYERLHNHNKAKHNKTVCIFLGIYCTMANMGNICR